MDPSNLPLVSPWMEERNYKFKLSGIIDVTASGTARNAIVVHRSLPSGSQTFHLAPVTAFRPHVPLSMRMRWLWQDLEKLCFHLRVFTQDGRIASCYAVGDLDKYDGDEPPSLYCGDTVHALLVYVLWPGTTLDYRFGPSFNIPERCHLSSPPTPQELELHGLHITSKSDRNYGRPPMMQSCWGCVCCLFKPHRGVHPGTGTRWCIHDAEYTIPDQLFEHRIGAIITPYLAKFTSEKVHIGKKYKTYQLLVQVGRTIDIPRTSPPVTVFTTAFQTTPVSPASVGLMSRGSSPRSPADARWEAIMLGEPCSHASSNYPPTVLEEVAPNGAAFLVSLDALPDLIQRKGLIPIAGIGGMDRVERSAISLSLVDLGYWVYWKDSNQCLGCAVLLVRERFRNGTAVVFAL